MKLNLVSKSRARMSLISILVMCILTTGTGVSAASLNKEVPAVNQQIAQSDVHKKSDDTKKTKKTSEKKAKSEEDAKQKLDQSMDMEIEIAPISKSMKKCSVIQDAYYQKPYLFQIMWLDVKEEMIGLAANPDTDYTDIEIAKKKKVKVYWAEDCLEYKDNEKVLDVLKDLLIRMESVYKKASMPFEKVIVTDVADVSDQSLMELEKTYYSDQTDFFTLLFPLIETKDQKKYLQKMMDEKNDYLYNLCTGKW